jgi:hypothetical protein
LFTEDVKLRYEESSSIDGHKETGGLWMRKGNPALQPHRQDSRSKSENMASSPFGRRSKDSPIGKSPLSPGRVLGSKKTGSMEANGDQVDPDERSADMTPGYFDQGKVENVQSGAKSTNAYEMETKESPEHFDATEDYYQRPGLISSQQSYQDISTPLSTTARYRHEKRKFGDHSRCDPC